MASGQRGDGGGGGGGGGGGSGAGPATPAAVVYEPFTTLPSVGQRAFQPVKELTLQRLLFLGTSSGVPTRERNTSCIAMILSSGRAVLVDCGEGTQHRMLFAADVSPRKVDAVFVTHLHGDHVFGLAPFLCTRGLQTAPGEDSEGGGALPEPFTIVGPRGVQDFVEFNLRAQGGFWAYPLHFIELDGDGPHDLGVLTDGLKVTACRLEHRIPAYGYVFDFPERPGGLDGAAARALGASGKDLGVLKTGQDVVLRSGAVIRSCDVTAPTQRGLRVAVLQDTRDSSLARAACAEADILIHECTYEQSLREKAVAHGHSTSEMAGLFAAEVKARALILTHFSGRYQWRSDAHRHVPKSSLPSSAAGNADAPSSGVAATACCLEDLRAEAAAAAPGVEVLLAEDFLAVARQRDGSLVPQSGLRSRVAPSSSAAAAAAAKAGAAHA